MKRLHRSAALALLGLWPLLASMPAPAATAAPPTLAPILAQVSPGVVNIAVEGTVESRPNPMLNDPFFRQFFKNAPMQPGKEKFQAVGSGVIFDAGNGYVLTNNHVIAHADRIMVTLKDQRQIKAKLVGTDPQTDVAVLKIAADHLTAVPLGESSDLQVGDYVVALGDPFGLGQTATFGIVSALGRTGLGIEGYEDFIQTDAAVNPGNSGGALIDMNGRLVGVNTAILTGGGSGNVGIGFAIPIDMAKRVATQLIAGGKIERGQLGVTIQDLTPEIARAMGVETSGGALVSEVLPGSAAAKAGIQAGDIIVTLDGKPVTGSAELRNAVGLTAPGTPMTLSIVRKGERLSLQATLQKAAAGEGETAAPDQSPLDGVKLSAIPADSPLRGKIKGVYVAAVASGSRAEEAGLQAGDVIASADQEPVATAEELLKIMKSHGNQALLLNIRRGNGSLFLIIQ